jgi:hypothetical protein
MPAYTNRQIKDAARRAFLETHHGRSTDDVILDDDLNADFITAAHAILPDVTAREFNHQLLNLRKSGRLGKVTTIRTSLPDRDEYWHAAHIAARFMEDHHDTTVDRVMCDPALRREFDSAASSVAPGYPTYVYRKAALNLRKGSLLQPELLSKIMRSSATTEFTDAATLLDDPTLIPALPGIYTFADDTGPLYIGESEHLRSRVSTHLDHSDRKSLAHYFWKNGVTNIRVETIAFPPGSLGTRAVNRRALEASLIQSRQPRFNIQHAPAT